MAVVHIANGEIQGWVIGSNTHDLRRLLASSGLSSVEAALYRIEFPAHGKHLIHTDGDDQFWLLV